MKTEGEFREILTILGIEKYSEEDLQELIQAHWMLYIQSPLLGKLSSSKLEHLSLKRG